jgi:hypothetical protein
LFTLVGHLKKGSVLYIYIKMKSMSKKIVLEELDRMRVLMGINVLSETSRSISHNLLMEGGKAIDDLIGLGPKSVDNLNRVGVNFRNDLTKLSDEFASRGIKTFDDLTNAVATVKSLPIANVTDDMIEAYIKNDPVLYTSILNKASEAASKIAMNLVKSADLSKVFSKSPLQLESYKTYLSTAPTQRNIDVLMDGVDKSTNEIEKIIDDIKNGKVPGVNEVPWDLNEMYETFLSKKLELFNFKNMGSKPNVTKVIPSIGKITPDRVQIKLGRNAERPFGTVQNIIIKLDGEDITSEDGVAGLGQMNVVIKDGEAVVGDIVIPEKYRNQGIATIVYQKVADELGVPIVNSKTKGFNQLEQGSYIWKNRDRFEPRNPIKSTEGGLYNDLQKTIRNSIDSPESTIATLRKIADEMEKSSKFNQQVKDRWKSGQ